MLVDAGVSRVFAKCTLSLQTSLMLEDNPYLWRFALASLSAFFKAMIIANFDSSREKWRNFHYPYIRSPKYSVRLHDFYSVFSEFLRSVNRLVEAT